MSISQHPSARPGASAPGPEELTSAALPGWFVINLCTLAAPLAVPQPRAPELKEFRFFLSRRVVEGHERFLLHMGFFRTHAEATKWLSVVRPTYPGASISRLTGAPAASGPPQPELSDTQALRVLQVRAPKRDDADTDTGSYSVRSEERMRGASPKAPSGAPASAKPEKPARVSTPRASKGFADELNALVASEIDLDNTDSLSATGVRHLRVQVERKASRSSRSATTRKP